MEDGIRQRQKEMQNYFFKKHYIFLLILHINEEQEIPGRRKVIRGSNARESEFPFVHYTTLSLAASFVSLCEAWLYLFW